MAKWNMGKSTESQKSRQIYRITFYNQDTIYEIYAKHVAESEMFGFIVVEEFVFGEHTSLVVDPSEEKLKIEFDQVVRTFIPVPSIIRIDEVEKEGIAKIKDARTKAGNISTFPKHALKRSDDK